MVRRALLGMVMAIAWAGSAQSGGTADFSLVAASFKNGGGSYALMEQMKQNLDLRGVTYTDRRLMDIARDCEAKVTSLGTRATPQTITCGDDKIGFQIQLIE